MFTFFQRVLLLCLGCLLFVNGQAQHLWGAGMEAFGPASKHISRSSDWPKGAEDVLRHPSRVYWYWVNGNERAYYAGELDTINEVVDQANGTLLVKAEVNKYGMDMRWELVVDSHEDCLVRSAKWFQRDDTTPSYTIETLGTLNTADRSTSHTARWLEGTNASPISIAVTSVTNQPDMELIERTEKALRAHRSQGLKARPRRRAGDLSNEL